MMAGKEFPRWFSGPAASRRVAGAVMRHGPVSRAQLAERLGLTAGTVSRAVGELLADGVIEEDGAEEAGRDWAAPKRGRPQHDLRIRAASHTFLGANIHDRSLTVSMVDAAGRPVGDSLTELLDGMGPGMVSAQIGRMARRVVKDATKDAFPSPTAIGVSIGGHVRGGRVVTQAPFVRWDEPIDLAGLVEEATGLPAAVFNDLDAFLVHEHWFGDAVDTDRFAVLTIGAGIGYALADDGKPVDCADQSYGLAAHILVDAHGPECSEGHIGCSQCLTEASMAEEYSAILGRDVSFADFTRDLENGKPQAARLGERTAFRLRALVATVANLAMPKLVVVSGESSFIARQSMESVRKGIDCFRHSQASPVRFTVPPFTWRLWSDAAATHALVRFLGE
ncbi:MAG: ROK family protein [Bifidobacterium sp.]|nr:ROK family protein [Bifidobacterium sp.]